MKRRRGGGFHFDVVAGANGVRTLTLCGAVHAHAAAFDPFLHARAALGGETRVDGMVEPPACLFRVNCDAQRYWRISICNVTVA
jgi:hypothetical protein